MFKGLFDIQTRFAKIDRNGGPFKQLNELIDWETFRPELSQLREHVDASKGGRPSVDPLLKFKMLILQSLYNLSDDGLEQQVLERLSFMRFLGLGMGEEVAEWSDNTRAQKDTEAKWTQKNGKQSFGYKNHIAPDVEHKPIRGFAVTPANAHDSNECESILSSNADPSVYADSAYMSEERVGRMSSPDSPYLPCIHENGYAKHPFTEEQKRANRARSTIRVRVEHVFAAQLQTADNLILRTIGLARATVKTGLRNLAYNMARFVILKRGIVS